MYETLDQDWVERAVVVVRAVEKFAGPMKGVQVVDDWAGDVAVYWPDISLVDSVRFNVEDQMHAPREYAEALEKALKEG